MPTISEFEYYESSEKYTVYKSGSLFLIVDRVNDKDHYVLAICEKDMREYVRSL